MRDIQNCSVCHLYVDINIYKDLGLFRKKKVYGNNSDMHPAGTRLVGFNLRIQTVVKNIIMSEN